jgi:hypothetical protein
MKPQEYPIAHFRLMAELAAILSGFPAQVLEHHYHDDSFGSWEIVFRFKGRKYRLVFNGKDGLLSFEEKAGTGWIEIMSVQAEKPGTDDMACLIRSALKP